MTKLHRKLGIGILICAVLIGGVGLPLQSGLTNQEGPQFTRTDYGPGMVILRHDPTTFDFHIPPPDSYLHPQAGTTTITIDYLPAGSQDVTGSTCYTWPAEAQAAFRYAADVWQTLVDSTVPIRIEACWTQFDEEGVLGYGGTMDYFISKSPQVVYPVSLANALSGTDMNDSDSYDSNGDGSDADPEAFVAYSSEFNWYYGTDGNTPADKVDFASVVLHEICHGLGFSGRASVNSSGVGSVGFQLNSGEIIPGIYDSFVENGSGQAITSFPNPSTQLGGQLTGGDLFFDGPNAKAANGGTAPELFVPSTWMPGSSYSHLDESFNGTANALMTYALNNGESNHNPGPVTMGLLKDLGWTTGSEPANTDPTISGLPDQTVPMNGSADNAIDLWNYASDAESSNSDLTFTIDNTPDSNAGVSLDSNRYIDINPTSGWTGQTNVTIRVADSGGLSDTDTFQVNIENLWDKTWSGAISANWHTPGNWDPYGVPTLSDAVLIPNVTNDPVISDTNAAVNSLMINQGAVLDLTSRALTVEDTLTNKGTLRQTQDLAEGNTTEFLHVTNQAGTQTKYYGVDITPSTGAPTVTTKSMPPKSPHSNNGSFSKTAPSVADINVSPTSFEETVPTDSVLTKTLTLSNIGQNTLSYTISDIETTTSMATHIKSKLSETMNAGIFEDGDTLTQEEQQLQRLPQYNDTPQNKLAIGDLPIVKSFPSPTSAPRGLEYDGTYLYVAQASSSEDYIYKIDPETGNTIDTYTWTSSGFPMGLAWDGTNFYVSDDTEDFIYVTDTSFNFVRSFSSPETWQRDLAYDGTNLLEATTTSDKVWTLATSDGAEIDVFSTPDNSPTGLAWDGTYIWLTNSDITGSEDYIYKLDTDGTVLEQYNAPGAYPTGLAFDGRYLWCVDWSEDTIYQLDIGSTSDDCPWLDESPKSGSIQADGHDNVTLSVDTTGLAVGEYSADIIINTNDPDENPVTVPITIQVTTTSSIPDIDITPATLEETARPDTQVTQTLTISNTGTASLLFVIGDNNTTWLEEIPNSGIVDAEKSASVNVIFDATGLTEGDYTTDLTFSTNDPDENPVTVPVTLHVSSNTAPILAGVPDVVVNPGSIYQPIDLWRYTIDLESPNAELTFQIDNTPDPQAGVRIDSNRYIAIDPTWTGQTTVVVRVTDPGGLSDTDSFVISVLSPDPDITLSPTSFEVTLHPNTQISHTLAISNTGAQALLFVISDGDITWLEETPTNGIVDPASAIPVNIKFDATGLASGDYTTNLTLSTNDPDENPVTVPITLHVLSGDINVSVSVSGNQFCSGRSNGVKRCFDIDTTLPISAAVRFYFTEAEQNGEKLADLVVWHYTFGWTEEPGPYSRNATSDLPYVEAQNITNFSPFALDICSTCERSAGSIFLPLVVKNYPPVPNTPTLNAIDNTDGDGNYTVSWNAVARATAYILQEDSSSSFSSPETRYTGSSTSWGATDKAQGTYYYRVQASNSYGTSGWSNVQAVTVSPPPSGPTPGLWEGPGLEFYVTPNRTQVDDFSVYIRIEGCGSYKITSGSKPTISNNNFSFSGSFYASGTFNSQTTASGTFGFNRFEVYGCGTITGGPYSWTATWENSSQPTIAPANGTSNTHIEPGPADTIHYWEIK